MLSTAPKTGGGAAPRDDGAAVPDAADTRQNENRNSPRLSASAVPAITGLRISPHGVEAALVNISESGALAECGERLKPGSAVTVVFEGTFSPRSIEGRVARNSVSSMGRDGRLRYHVGISFTRTIDLSAYQAPAREPESVPAPPAEPVPTAQATDVAPEPSQVAGPLTGTPADAGDADSGMVEFEVPLPAAEVVRNRW